MKSVKCYSVVNTTVISFLHLIIESEEILNDFTEKYPYWNENKYLNQMPVYKRVFVKAAYGRCFFVLRLLAKLHTRLAG